MSLAHPAQAQHELSISRLIDAPPAKVFRAWTEPQWLMQWWGPQGMTTPECEMQLWVGGLFRTLMRARVSADREAFSRSINTISAKIGSQLGFSTIADMAHRFGISGQISTYLRAMGSTVPQIYGPSADEP